MRPDHTGGETILRANRAGRERRESGKRFLLKCSGRWLPTHGSSSAQHRACRSVLCRLRLPPSVLRWRRSQHLLSRCRLAAAKISPPRLTHLLTLPARRCPNPPGSTARRPLTRKMSVPRHRISGTQHSMTATPRPMSRPDTRRASPKATALRRITPNEERGERHTPRIGAFPRLITETGRPDREPKPSRTPARGGRAGRN